jgi:hypothetical protein
VKNIDEMEKLAAAATPGPWKIDVAWSDDLITVANSRGDNIFGDQCVGAMDDEADVATARFIAASRDFVPWACDRIRKLEAVAKAAFVVTRVNAKEAWVFDLAIALKELERQ